jgi:Asp-tRNA(Asn)/Glu-tRNA(Gln) amidotransferase A subunit family amidase
MADFQHTLRLTALQMRDGFARAPGLLSGFYSHYFDFLTEADKDIQAFASLDRRLLNAQIDRLQQQTTEGMAHSPLFGVPVAIKDIIDTLDFPTCYGSPIYQGRMALSDATVVHRLRQAGAVIVGKTVTTEFATFVPGPTRNPVNPAHTPGGSSSGSAAAVAAGFVPLALGTQTNGSVLRPASFCGVYGFKPSIGVLPRTGVFEQSPSLDQVGVFARSIDDLALIVDIMSGDDGRDFSTRGLAPRRLFDVAVSDPAVVPRFCFVKTPWWDQISPEAQTAYLEFVAELDGLVTIVDMPEGMAQVERWHSHVNEVELAYALRNELANSPEGLSDVLRQRVMQGAAIPVMDYLASRHEMLAVRSAFDGYFDHFDGILCPAALGGAPQGLSSTGNPIMQTVWTFAGLPSISIPALTLSNGMPLGVQAVGPYQQDGRLLRSVRWLSEQFN